MDFGYYFLIRDYKEEDISLKKGHTVYVIQIEDGFAKTSSGAIIDIKSTITEGPWQALESAPSSIDGKSKVAPVQPKRKAVKKSE